MEINKIHTGEAKEVLKTFEDKCVHCIVTSPPYFGLRDYGTSIWVGGDESCNHKRDTKNANPDWLIQSRGKVDNGVGDEIFKSVCAKCWAKRIDQQLGLEETPELYVKTMVDVFREAKRVLRDDGTLWLNIGDSYAAYWGQKYGQGQSLSGTRENNGSAPPSKKSPLFSGGIKPKDLFGIPWMLAFALRADGWYLRQDIIWNKPNPMPESVTDRCTKSHEYIFLLSKSAKYYYDADAISTEMKGEAFHMIPKGWAVGAGSHSSISHATVEGQRRKVKNIAEKSYGLNGSGFENHSGNYNPEGELIGSGKANKRSVWTVATMPYSEAHFATFPPKLITDCIKAGCPEGGIVLDPFMGAGTTAMVARKLNRNFIGIELNPDYVAIANERLKKELGMFI